jgi:hypothetical protein
MPRHKSLDVPMSPQLSPIVVAINKIKKSVSSCQKWGRGVALLQNRYTITIEMDYKELLNGLPDGSCKWVALGV